MGESSNKSAPNFDAAVAGVSPSKSATIGKREAEDEPEKLVTAKKQKRDWVSENQRKESSSDDSFSDPGNSDEDSGLNDSKLATAEGKSGPSAVKKKVESRSDTGSSSIDKDDIKTEATIVPEKFPDASEKDPAKEVDSSKASGLDSDTRTNEDMDNVTTSSKELLATSAAGNNISTKKVESSNDSSLDSGLDEEDVQKAHVTSSKKLPASSVAQREGIEKIDNSYDESREGFDECNVSEENEEIKEKPSTTPQKNVKDDEMVDAASTGATRKEPKSAAAPEKQNATSKKIFVGNLSYEVKRANLEDLFKNCGEIVDVSFGLYRDGMFRGFAHVEFATEEAAKHALMLNGRELLRRFVRIEIAREKFAYTPNSSCMNRNNSLKGFQASFGEDGPTTSAPSEEQNARSKMLFVGNLSYSAERADLENLFKDCGEIVDIRFATDREGRFKGFAHVLFDTEEAAQSALMLNGEELLRRPLRLDLAPERGAYTRSIKNEATREDPSLAGNEARMPAAPKEQNATSKTVFVGNLSYSVERVDLENLFKDCGEIIDIRLATDREGRFKGFGHVEFATQEAARNALKLNGNELLRQYIRLDLANEKIVHSSSSRDGSGSVESQTVFVRGFDTSLREDEIRNSLEEHFSSCGVISRISIARDYGTGSTKGYAWLDFMDVDGFNKALELDGIEVGGYILSVERRRPRRYIQDGRGGSDQIGGWRGGDQIGGWHGGDQFGGWRGGDQVGGWHGGGQWGHGRGYASRWH
ncbi:nucleolin 1-like isoform X2 [Prosopis cineraria]|uniref:nucleolin 1-like isoform X2 n=1 Tax=Prosopis cineraria TaxID=364024 RepID=UPI00240EBC7A|nr:nucleolin 1-like isoform X2 [Prosopis cineraria]